MTAGPLVRGPGTPDWFVRQNTVVARPPLVPEIALHLASEVVPLWQSTEAALAESGLPPPFWAFAWAGGQALARYLLDHPNRVAGRRVLDFAAGSGIQGIAALKAGAATVEASEVDPFAAAALRLNARLNGVELAVTEANLIGRDTRQRPAWEVVLAGDVCYEQPMAGEVAAWLRRLAGRDTLVLLGDPGRSYLPGNGLERLAVYSVKTTRELEDTDLRRTAVWRVLA